MPPSINDKFGKASISNNYAIATTVKTTRAAGVTVLEAFDLSKYAPDTPVFFVTYKKTTDPVTNITSVTNLVSWKGLVNTSANTLTNLTVAPGYTDLGNAVGDFVECIPTSYWNNSLIEGLLVSHNPDGTLKSVTENPGWTQLTGAAVTAVTNNGNRSYELAVNTDVSNALSPGMRLRTTRTVAAPTQSASLNGTTHYFSKVSPAGMTFTDDFVVSAWVKLSSYPASRGLIASRYNGTNGWDFSVLNDGRVFIEAFNGSSTNYSQILSLQSLPLNKWVHISAQLDMSTFTGTPTTSYLMLDGVDIPGSVGRAGTNPTALVQAGDLTIGYNPNFVNSYFPGKIAQVAIFSAKVTQAAMRGYMSQGLTGTEPSLVAAYSLSNSLNDLTANANHLTANGGVVVTNADSPFGGQANGTISNILDYGIIQKVTASTITVQVPEGCAIPTSGGVAAVSYSSVKSPYGFPSEQPKWVLETCINSGPSVGGATANVWYNAPGGKIIAPTGKWKGSTAASVQVLSSGTAVDSYSVLSATAAADGMPESRAGGYAGGNVSNVVFAHSAQNIPLDVPSATPYYFNFKVSAGSVSAQNLRSDYVLPRIVIENAYL